MNYWGEGNHQNPPPGWFDNWGWILAVVAVCVVAPLLAAFAIKISS